MQATIRPYQSSDSNTFLPLNESCVPEVGSIDAQRLDLLARCAAMFLVVEIHERFGFIEIARLRPYHPDAEVAMYECALRRDS